MIGSPLRHARLLVGICCVAVATVAAADSPASGNGPVSVLILPPLFLVSEADQARTAQEHFGSEASNVLGSDPRFRVVDQPVLNESEMDHVGNHLRLFLLAAASLESARTGGRAWLDVRKATDYRIGDGLRFLADRTDAELALMIVGTRARSDLPTRGSVATARAPLRTGVEPGFVEPKVEPSGTPRTYYAGYLNPNEVLCGLVDLQTGRIVWYDKRQLVMESSLWVTALNARDQIAAQFKDYPRSSGLNFVDRSTLESRP